MRTQKRPTPLPPAAATDPHAPEELLARLEATRAELGAVYVELEHLDRLATMGTIAGMIAHEFNNILTPMLSYAQLAAAAPEDADLVRKALRQTIAGVERASKITDAILAFVREDPCGTGHAPSLPSAEAPHAAGCEVARVVDDAIACLARHPERDGVRLRVEVPRNMHAAIQPIALQQVLVNVIMNARNAMGSRGGKLSISSESMSEPPRVPEGAVVSREGGCSTWNTPPAPRLSGNGWVVVRVHDRGPGMTAEHLMQLFTPFRTTSQGPRRGTGLGLVIMKRLIEAVGGWLYVESAPGRGTNVSIVLPGILPNN